MTDSERLDFIDSILRSGLTFGVKPNYKTLVGTVFLKEGPKSIREVIDAIKQINDDPDGASKVEK